jgi:D-serine deaminase-like pyridoxal phosphate-dependent protein
MFDFGMNSCSDECGENYQRIVGPKFRNIESVERVVQREEIALAVLKEPDNSVKVGNAYELIPAHADTTAKLHDKYYGIRDGRVELIIPNHGRGLY